MPGFLNHQAENKECHCDSSVSIPSGFGGLRFQSKIRNRNHPCSDLVSRSDVHKSWCMKSIQILRKMNLITHEVSCDVMSKFIELGEVLNYDVQNEKEDLNNKLVCMGVMWSS